MSTNSNSQHAMADYPPTADHPSSPFAGGMIRPTPRWVRIAGIVTVLSAVLLLGLGGFVTTFRAGMADPVWPTEPWYLINNYKVDAGYLLEHVHRILGWVTGLAVSVFAFGAWLAEPNRRLRLVGLICLVGLLAIYGDFHGKMGRIWNEVKQKAAAAGVIDLTSPDAETQLTQMNVAQHVAKWPVPQGLGTAAFGVGLILLGASAAASGQPGGWARLFASLGLVAVMMQGLLGGFRVFLNAIAGTNLAAIHGVFGQLVFAVLIAAMILCAPRRPGDALTVTERSPLLKLAYATLAVLILQLVWASWVRHIGSPVAQRLHILTAFVATGLIVWLALRIVSNESSARLYRGTAIHLLVILSCQLALGVEAYLGKFAAIGPQAQLLPFERTVTPGAAWVRTGHQLIGAGLLAAVAAACVRFHRRPLPGEPTMTVTTTETTTGTPAAHSTRTSDLALASSLS